MAKEWLIEASEIFIWDRRLRASVCTVLHSKSGACVCLRLSFYLVLSSALLFFLPQIRRGEGVAEWKNKLFRRKFYLPNMFSLNYHRRHHVVGKLVFSSSFSWQIKFIAFCAWLFAISSNSLATIVRVILYEFWRFPLTREICNLIIGKLCEGVYIVFLNASLCWRYTVYLLV